MNWTLHLPQGSPPAGLSANHRTHWRTRARSTEELRTLVKILAVQQRIPTMQRMQVEVVWVVADKRRRDDDNLTPMAKVIYDALGADKGIGAHLVPDDAHEFMVKLHPRIEYRPDERPHFEVRIWDISNRPDGVDEVARRL